jgi:NAD-dependent dihydropyrimidine dehydrogenase PreA subunit
MRHQYLKNVTTLKLETDACTGCGRCLEVCPHQVFTLENGKSQVIHQDRCMECGACAQNCPCGAITVAPGVGCAAAVLKGWLTRSEPSCDCSEDGSSCCG